MNQSLAVQAVPETPACADAFRLGMRRLLGAVNILATWQADGQPVGLCATAVCSVSAEPPTLLACVNQSSTLGQVIAAGQRLSVNVLGAADEPLARVFGGMAGVESGRRFEHGNWRLEAGQAPSLPGAAAVFQCRVVDVHRVATHLVLIARVEAVALGSAVQPGALGYLEGRFCPLP